MLDQQQKKWCAESRWDFWDLEALFRDGTLEKVSGAAPTFPPDYR